MADLLFTRFIKETRDLGRQLDVWARPRLKSIYGLRPRDFEGVTDDELIDRVMRSWVDSDVTAVTRAGAPIPPDRPGQSERRDPDGYDRPPMWRWTLRLRVEGNRELLERWPAKFDREPCGDDVYYLPVPDWVCGLWEGGVYVQVDVPRGEDPDGTCMPRDRFGAAVEYLDEFIRCATEEAAEYETVLRARMRDRLMEERRRFDTIAPQGAELVELLRVSELPLDLEEAEAPAAEAPTVEVEDGAPVALTRLLGERTFADLVAVTRKWGSAVEQYPGAFRRLKEEELSSLLVASLNVAFDVASREVFSVNGKTDLFVESVRNDRENAAFFGEAKIWHGAKQLINLDVPQTLGYANARTSDSMVLYYVRQLDLGLNERRSREAFEQLPTFTDWVAEDVAMLQHPDYGQPIRLTIVRIHIPPPGEDVSDPDDLPEADVASEPI